MRLKANRTNIIYVTLIIAININEPIPWISLRGSNFF